MAIVTDDRIPDDDVPISYSKLPDINTFDVVVGDIDLFVDTHTLERNAYGGFAYSAPTKQGRGPRTPKAGYEISKPRESLPSAFLSRPSYSEALLLLKLLKKYGKSPAGLEWILLRQCMDDVYQKLPIVDRDTFLKKIKRIGDRIMRFEVRLQNMTVPLFVHQLEHYQKGIFEGAGVLEPSIKHPYQYDAGLVAIVGQTGSTLHMNIFSIWVRQIDMRTVLVDWEELQGNGQWAKNMQVWVSNTFGVDVAPIVEIQGQAVGLSDEERTQLKIVQGYYVAKRQGATTKDKYCEAKGISTKTFGRWEEKLISLGAIK